MKKLLFGVLVILITVGALYTTFTVSSKSTSCSACHSMQRNYQSWVNSKHSNVAQCIDCHLPHQQPVQTVLYKTSIGLRDTVSEMVGPPDFVQVTTNTLDVVNSNCQRCHSKPLHKFQVPSQFRCTDCHRFTPHGV